jgi:hypothetical protein
VEFRLGDMYAADVRSATVVTLFLHPGPNLKLREKLRSELPAGSRVVSYVWDMGSWTPAEVRPVNEHRMFLWRIPSRAGLITSPKLSQQQESAILSRSTSRCHAVVSSRRPPLLVDAAIQQADGRAAFHAARWAGFSLRLTARCGQPT